MKRGEKPKMKSRNKRQKSAGPEKVQGRTGRESNLLLSQNIKISSVWKKTSLIQTKNHYASTLKLFYTEFRQKISVQTY